MADEKPSYCTSTLSQAFIGSLAFYGGLLLLVAAGLIWFSLDAEKAKLVVGWASALQASITAAYLTARKVNGNGGSQHEPPVQPPA